MTTGLKLIGLGLLILTLGACARGDPELMNIRQTEAGPDEFMILPGKPLETPPSYSELPRPIRPNNRPDLPLANIKRDVLNRHNPAKSQGNILHLHHHPTDLATVFRGVTLRGIKHLISHSFYGSSPPKGMVGGASPTGERQLSFRGNSIGHRRHNLRFHDLQIGADVSLAPVFIGHFGLS